jgi:AcrR family transcriptional regulator
MAIVREPMAAQAPMTLKEAKRARGATADGPSELASIPTSERILEKAERVFAQSGFDGASIRQIALAADVPVALLGYHFGSKEGLYRAVFDRRAPTVVEQRLAGLAIAEMEPDLDRRLELIVKALVLPMLRLRAHDKDPSFGRLMAHETTDPKSQSRGFIRDIFDPVAYKVMEALASALPDRSAEDINWAYQFMLGAMVYVMADTGRIARLSDGLCRPEDEMSTVAYLVSFLTAGTRFGLPPKGLEQSRRTATAKAEKARKKNQRHEQGEKSDATGDVSTKRGTGKGRRLSRR